MLLLWGDRDVVIPFTERRDDAAALSPNISVRALPGVGHESLFESLFEDGAALAAQIVGWLD